eukprot:TRINITY_DN6052_c0_g1_i5.p1 TRINITY_DN6052_c0_g1~~TRINITY_DN6052_c0_g1_i5.p1  ORF type:complete len:107 (+),score=29.42 TRINITY_DN6052_c0_g1_i5:60-380(+)
MAEDKEVSDTTITPLISGTIIKCSEATNETLATQRKVLGKLLEIESKLSAIYSTDVALNECIKSALERSATLKERVNKLSNYIETIENRVIGIGQMVLNDSIFAKP